MQDILYKHKLDLRIRLWKAWGIYNIGKRLKAFTVLKIQITKIEKMLEKIRLKGRKKGKKKALDV
jgi:hypothetical protein